MSNHRAAECGRRCQVLSRGAGIRLRAEVSWSDLIDPNSPAAFDATPPMDGKP